MLNDHIRKKHAPEREKPPELDSFDCPLCGTKARPNLYRKLEGHVVKTYGERGNYKCNECNASSIYEHAKSKSPGPNKNILIRQLLKDGEGERSGSDFEAK